MKLGKFSLMEYSCMAGVFLSFNSKTSAQVIYTDLEPDIELQFNGETAFIDMDNDGTNDFAFLKTSGGYYHYWTSATSTGVYRFRHGIWAGPEYIFNEIAARSVTHGSYGGSTDYFPYAFEFGILINELISFQNAGFQLLGSGFYQTVIDSEHWADRFGSWNPDVINNFLGVRFKSTDDCMHYGWIRCTTADSTKRLIIHDYAFETACEHPIEAGSLSSYVDIQNQANDFNATVYSFNKNIYIHTEIFQNAELIICDLSGKHIINSILQSSYETIGMTNYPSGVYFVTLIQEGHRFDKKVFIE